VIGEERRRNRMALEKEREKCDFVPQIIADYDVLNLCFNE